MFGRIENIGGNPRALMVLLVLFGVLVLTVAVQVSRFAGAADASSEPPTASPGSTDPKAPAPDTAPKPPSGSTSEPDSTQPPSQTPTQSPPKITTPAGAKPSDPGVPYTISGTISTPLRPGEAAVPIDVAFASTNAGNGGTGVSGVRVSSLVVTITAVTGPNIGASRPCSTTDFVLTQFEGRYPFTIPEGSSSLSSLGFASGTWPTLRMKETGANQNGCKRATVSLAYTGTA